MLEHDRFFDRFPGCFIERSITAAARFGLLLVLGSPGLGCGSRPAPEASTAPAGATGPAGAATAAPSAALADPRDSTQTTPSAPSAAESAGATTVAAGAPTWLIDVSPNGSWIAYCEVREDTNGNGVLDATLDTTSKPAGDRFTPLLAISSALAEPLEALLASDPTGRYVVARLAGTTWLIDTREGKRTDLDALGLDARGDGLDHWPERSLSFDAGGQRLLFLKHVGRLAYEVLLYALPAGPAKAFALKNQEVWRARLSPEGRHAVLTVVVDDTSGNGQLGWPVPVRKPTTECGSKLPRYSEWIDRGDATVTRVLDLQTGRSQIHPDFATPLGQSYLVRDNSSRLWQHGGDKPKRWAPAECNARVLHADARRGLSLVACVGPDPSKQPKNKNPEPPRTRWPVYLVSPTLYRDLETTVAPFGSDTWSDQSPRLVPIYAGAETWLFDFERQSKIALNGSDRVMHAVDHLALIHRDDDLFLFDARTLKSQRLVRGVDWLPHYWTRGDWAIVSPFLVDVRRGQVMGTIPPGTAALALDGRLLIAETPGEDLDNFDAGGYRWTAPFDR